MSGADFAAFRFAIAHGALRGLTLVRLTLLI